MLAAPDARIGEPKKPWRARMVINPPKLRSPSEAARMEITMNIMKLYRYGGFRPIHITSLRGEKNVGPTASKVRVSPSHANS
jgi:hypothetical protein